MFVKSSMTVWVVLDVNERFLEIAKQAKLKFPSETGLSPVEEKFAQLIVGECLKKIADVPLWYDDYRDQILNAMRDSCIRSVKTHFGVEE